MGVLPAYTDNLVTAYLGNDLDVLRHIDDASVDLIFTSPPYNLSRNSGFARPGNKVGKWSGGGLATGYGCHGDDLPLADYIDWQQTVLTALWGKLSDHGAIFYNHKPRIQQKQLWTPLELNPGLPLRQIIIWARPGGLNFSPTHFCPSHEWIMLFAKPGYSLKSRGVSGFGDVWSAAPERNEHSAPFPLRLPSIAIEASANIERVLDPYAGSGTTLKAASLAAIPSIGIDNDPTCIPMIERRLAQQTLPF